MTSPMASVLKSSIAAAAFPAAPWHCPTCPLSACRQISQPARPPSMVRAAPSSTRATISAAKASRFPSPAFAGRLDQRGAVYYIDPNFRLVVRGKPPLRSLPNATKKTRSSPRRRKSAAFNSAPPRPRKERHLFLRYSFSQTDLTRILIPALVPTDDQHVRLSTLAANLTRDTRDNALDEHKGVLQSLELDFNTTKLGSSVDFAKLTGQAAFYKEKFHHIVWANSIRIGLAEPFANSRVPLSEAFFTGGGNSLRGFPLDGAGPQRQVQVCSSGSSSNCTVHPGAQRRQRTSPSQCRGAHSAAYQEGSQRCSFLRWRQRFPRCRIS